MTNFEKFSGKYVMISWGNDTNLEMSEQALLSLLPGLRDFFP